ncbi:PilZ domain-containing protein [Parachitinimonas caeni]|uniref:PilZ domain-containing protein n=1 Tax=Parachitinimonas caeni TaxID=3031301 RepID=A0ABT7DWB1_9NEIS|nr:PilZ domain-containing protein [Parachitinimonas caeni]MDK2123445.1 PilZ domain-containing protein [Parachitinimonas caeni]
MSPVEQRIDRRIPINCPVKIRTKDLGDPWYGVCTDLSVSGMSIQTSFVPREDEELEVMVIPPQGLNGGTQKPLAALVRVRRCHEIERGRLYEIGLEILSIRQ